MMLCSTFQKVQSYTVKVASVDGTFEMTTKISNSHTWITLGRNCSQAIDAFQLILINWRKKKKIFLSLSESEKTAYAYWCCD